ncbi:MAG: LamG domain-containing protein [Clostridia bacterium]|nr:LamG domain-containing protein [Clostridia bacterium]
MKRKLFVALLLVAAMLLTSAVALAAEPVLQVTFDSEDEDFLLNGGAVLEDGVVKLPGGAMRSGYVELPFAALMDTDKETTISMWLYVPAETNSNTYFVSFANGNSWPGFIGRVLPNGQIGINFDNRGIMVTEPVFPFDGWVHVSLSISKTSMTVYLNGVRAAKYDGAANVFENCGWYKINGVDVGTTHYHELDKINMPSGFLGTPTYNFYYELTNDSMAMYDDYRVYDVALDDAEAAELFASLTCPAAAWPIGAEADPTQQPAEIELPVVPEDGLRVKLTFDNEDEMYTLYNNAQIKNGALDLPGGEFRKAGHLELPDYAIASCTNAMTVSTWVNYDNFTIGDQFIYSVSANDAWPAIFLMLWQDGSVHYNIDYRGQLNCDYKLPAKTWVYLTAVVSDDEISIYADGKLASTYSSRTGKAQGGNFEMLNVKTNQTHFTQVDRVANKTFRLGSSFMDIGYTRVDSIAKFDNFSIYSKALNAEEVAALYAAECAETNYAK